MVVVVLLVVAELTVTSRLGSLGECSDHHKCAHWINFDAHSLLGILVFVPKLENFGSRVLARTQFFEGLLWILLCFRTTSVGFCLWALAFFIFLLTLTFA